jgi:hypothetical protein
MPRRDGEVFLFGTAMTTPDGAKLTENAVERGLIEDALR